MPTARKGRRLNKPHFALNGDGKVLVPLTRGYTAIIDAKDLRKVIKHSWCARLARRRVYAEANIKIGGVWKRVMLHRFLMGSDSQLHVDHRDGDGLNNTRSNLRFATRSQNAHNCGPDAKANKTSRFKGVCWNKGMKKWLAQIMANRKHRIIGYFLTEEEAASAYDQAARELHGEFAHTNSQESQS